MVSLIQNRSIFSVMIDKVREIELPLSRLRNALMSKGHDGPQQDIIKNNIAENEAKAAHADELLAAWAQITQNEKLISDYMTGLEHIMFMTQHKLRKPVTNMLGIVALLDRQDNSAEELHRIAQYILKSAMDLDTYTRELTAILVELSQKGKK